MKMTKLSFVGQSKAVEFAIAIILASLFVLPFLSFAGSQKKIYVDAKNLGTEDGSAANPFNTISEALRSAAKETDVHIANGTYRENIEIPKEVSVFGESRSGVIILAKNDDKAAVVMKDDTKINKVTIRLGKNGIKVKEDAEVSIIDCIIEDSEDDGISIEKGKVGKDQMVSISDSTIRNNERAGIFSEKRKLSLIDNEIVSNDKDGLVMQKGVSAWLEGNNFEENDGVGLRAVLDGSKIWTKNNKVEENKKGGVMIDAYGASGRIDLKKTKFTDNDNFAVIRIARGSNVGNVWNGLTFNKNTYKETGKGELSPVIVK